MTHQHNSIYKQNKNGQTADVFSGLKQLLTVSLLSWFQIPFKEGGTGEELLACLRANKPGSWAQ
jgi:hypothetical protein